jgi:GNAT superfamily N-acetyltransferase
MGTNFYIDTVDFGTPECDDILQLRYEVLRKPLGLMFDVEDISQEYGDIHMGCYDVNSDELTGCLLLRPITGERIKMRQVAVRPELHGKGIGRFMVTHSEKWSRDQGFEQMELHARLQAVDFYEKLGYTKKGDMFKEVQLDHYFMYKIL